MVHRIQCAIHAYIFVHHIQYMYPKSLSSFMSKALLHLWMTAEAKVTVWGARNCRCMCILILTFLPPLCLVMAVSVIKYDVYSKFWYSHEVQVHAQDCTCHQLSSSTLIDVVYLLVVLKLVHPCCSRNGGIPSFSCYGTSMTCTFVFWCKCVCDVCTYMVMVVT